MSKRFVVGILLIFISVLVLLMNSNGSVEIKFGLFDLEMLKSFAFFSFLGTGVLIGFMLR